MSLAIGLLALVAAAATFLHTWKVAAVHSERFEHLDRRFADGLDSVWKTDLEHRLVIMDSAIETGLLRAKRSEERTRGIVRSALKKLDEAGFEDPALEAEAEQLQLEHGAGSEVRELHPVPDGVVDDQSNDVPSGIPGLSESEVQALKARRQAG